MEGALLQLPFHVGGGPASVGSHAGMAVASNAITMGKIKALSAHSTKLTTQRNLAEPRRHDPYRTTSKPKGTPQCAVCRSVSVRGRWIPERNLTTSPNERTSGKKTLCPACQQERDKYAGGVIELHGTTWSGHQKQVYETISNTEEIARSRNDQMRVLWTRTYRGVTKIYVTLPELARHIGRTLQKSFKGVTEYHGSSEEPYRRVIWNSDGSTQRRRKR